MTPSDRNPRRRRRTPMRAVGAVLAMVLGAGLGAPIAWGADQAAQVARDAVNNLAARNLAAVEARFTPEMAQALPLAALGRTWSAIMAQGGAVRGVAALRSMQPAPNGVMVVTIPITFERLALDVRVAVAQDKIAGLFFAPAPLAAAPLSAPPFADAAAFTTVEVTVGPAALGGTLMLPKDARDAHKVAAIVLIHGSGPSDRDETIGPNRIFRDLAEGLASRGIATLRYDKRTKAHPELFTATSTVRDETMDDAVAAVALLRQRTEIDPDRIIILGHSLGGTLAPRIAAGDPDIAAAIIMAGATRPLPSITVEQVEYITALHGTPDARGQQQIAELKRDAARALAARPGDVGPPIMGVPPAYWADLNGYDPAVTAQQLAIPMLILQGGRDYQVTSADLQHFKDALAGHANVAIREFPRLNHLFIAGDGQSRPEEYETPGHVDAAVIDAIAAFVAGVGKQGG